MTPENPSDQMSSSNSDLQSELPKSEGNSTSPKSSVKKILALGLVFIVVASLLAIFVIMGVTTQRGPANQSAEPTTVVISPTPSTIPTEVVAPTETSDFPKAQVLDRNFNTATRLGSINNMLPYEKNAIYLVTHKGEDALYLTSGNKDGSQSVLMYYEEGQLISSEELPDPAISRIQVFTGRQPEDVLFLTGFSFDPKRENIYFSMVSHSVENTSPNPDTSNVFQFNFSNETLNIIIQKRVIEEKFLDYTGAFNVEQALSDKHLILTVGECYACDGVKAKTLVLNVENLTYKLLGDGRITDVSYDSIDNMISFRLISLDGYGEGEALPIPTFVTSTEVFSTDLP